MNIEEIKQLISAADTCGHVPLIKGVHGIGKSEAVIQHAIDQNMHYEPLILSLMDTSDLMGIPFTIPVGGLSSTTWAAPTWYTNIVNVAWPEELEVGDLEFNDKKFEEFVKSNIGL